MNKWIKLSCFTIIFLCVMLFVGCNNNIPLPEETLVWLNMNTDYELSDCLPEGSGEKVKVILLLGQSNATGCSINEYLKKHVGDIKYSEYESGYSNILINYCLDDHNADSKGSFVPVDLTCGAGNGFFGPEVGMAEVLSQEFEDEKIYILKYTMSGYSLNYHWLQNGQRGSIYEAFLKFATTYLEYMTQKNYIPEIGAICWMQGESDTTEYKASKYVENQKAFASYLREDLKKYSREDGIYFIDAGISNSPYCEPSYPEINKAKEEFSKLSPLNIYFSTIDLGYTIHKEPEGSPDWGHYDAESELALGHEFANRIVNIYKDIKEN